MKTLKKWGLFKVFEQLVAVSNTQ